MRGDFDVQWYSASVREEARKVFLLMCCSAFVLLIVRIAATMGRWWLPAAWYQLDPTIGCRLLCCLFKKEIDSTFDCSEYFIGPVRDMAVGTGQWPVAI